MTTDLPLTRRKRIVFRLLLLAFPFALLAAAELTLRLTAGDDVSRDPLINVSPFTVFERTKVDGREYYRISHPLTYANNSRVFEVEKPADSIRVFCLGGSACAGWPHPPEETFSAYLERGLQAAYPGKRVEVINAAAHGFASYRVRYMLNDVLEMDPDAVIVWCGNNEFLEARRYSRAMVAVERFGLDRLLVAQRLALLFSRTRSEMPAAELKGAADFFWKKVRRESLELRSDPEQFEGVKQHYADSIEHIAKRAGARGVPLVLCTVPVNLRDWQPTVSHNPLENGEQDAWQKLLDLGQRHVMMSRTNDAVATLKRAAELNPLHAATHFWLARALEMAGRIPEARDEYSQARDLDYNPFRAITAFNETIRRVAGESRGVVLVDLAAAFDDASDPGIAGFDLFLDYVHPTKRGNLVAAGSLFDALTGGILGGTPAVTAFPRALAAGRPDYNEKADPAVQGTLFPVFVMNHQYAKALENGRLLVSLGSGRELPEDAAMLPAGGPEAVRELYAAIFQYEAARRRVLLEDAGPAELEAARAKLHAAYARHYPYGTF